MAKRVPKFQVNDEVEYRMENISGVGKVLAVRQGFFGGIKYDIQSVAYRDSLLFKQSWSAVEVNTIPETDVYRKIGSYGYSSDYDT